MDQKNENLFKNASQEITEGFLNALCNAYVSSYYLDLKNEKYYAIGQMKTYNERYGSENDWSGMDAYIRECIHEDDQALITKVSRIDYIRERLKKEQSYSIQVRDNGTGEERWYSYTIMRGADEDHAAAIYTDITEYVLQHQELKKEHAVVNALSKSYLDVYIIDVAAKTGEIVKLDGYVTRGMSKDKIGPYPYEATCMAYINNRVYSEDQKMVADCMKLENLLMQLKDKKEYEFTYRVPENGEINYYQGKYVLVDEGYIICGFQNIDEIVKKEKEQKEELQNRMSIIQSAIKVYFAAYYIDIASDSYTELSTIDNIKQSGFASTGNAQESLFRICSVLIHPEFKTDMEKFVDMSTLNERLRDKDMVTMQYVGNTTGWSQAFFIAGERNEDGTLKTAIWGARTIHEEKERELSQLKKIEEALNAADAANSAKTTFLFNMSHDIRTPMNAIIGFTNLLEKHQEDPEKRQDYLNKIQDSSSVLLSIINNVLEMARIEKGTLVIDETAWSTEQFNDTLYSVFNVMMKEKGITFTRQIDVQHHYVYCDPTKLREIFINILSNAYKYTNAGGSVNMHLEEIPSDREGWVLYQTTITDTGIGMSEEFLPHIFEEFSREQNTTDAKVEGTGLGMPIVKRLVEMLDGTIEVRSKKGEGSTFIVTIPHRISDKANLVNHAGVELDPNLFKGKRILLAEDNDLNAEIAIEILKEAGFVVDRAEDGRACVNMLEKAENSYYDLILMDIQMPVMNGYEAAKAIRQLADHSKANTKILAMTANAFEEDKREALRAGMNGHLEKPIDVKELMKTLATMIG